LLKNNLIGLIIYEVNKDRESFRSISMIPGLQILIINWISDYFCDKLFITWQGYYPLPPIMNTINEYYNKRAKEYEQIYHRDDPQMQSELAKIKNLLLKSFRNKSVLEIASGTGYWTEAVANTAKNVTAVDFSTEMLAKAKEKNIKAEFINDNVYSLEKVKGNFNSGLANFWFSHISKFQINSFLNTFHKKLKPNSTIIMADNIYDEEFGGVLIEGTNDENTYKYRTLKDGTSYQIIKNYYNEEELNAIFKMYSLEIKIHFGKYYWWIKYKLN
jgi:ubiquinone/menaquinone biosynthesis C-methylase UbiE